MYTEARARRVSCANTSGIRAWHARCEWGICKHRAVHECGEKTVRDGKYRLRRRTMNPNPYNQYDPAQPGVPRRDVVQTEGASPAFSIGWIIYVILGIVVALIILRVVLK